MNDPNARVRRLARTQLDHRLDRIREAFSALSPPRGGWVSAVRNALGMTQTHLADRLGVSRQAIGQLEARETDGSATLRALEEAAHALGGRLVYAIVPERSIDQTLEARALRVAERMTGSVRHTMRLEDQEPDSDLDMVTRDLAEDLMDDPRRLWSDPNE